MIATTRTSMCTTTSHGPPAERMRDKPVEQSGAPSYPERQYKWCETDSASRQTVFPNRFGSLSLSLSVNHKTEIANLGEEARLCRVPSLYVDEDGRRSRCRRPKAIVSASKMSSPIPPRYLRIEMNDVTRSLLPLTSFWILFTARVALLLCFPAKKW